MVKSGIAGAKIGLDAEVGEFKCVQEGKRPEYGPVRKLSRLGDKR